MRSNKDKNKRDKSTYHRLGIPLFLFVLILTSATSFAHPMGNFSVNHYSKITIGQQSIEIRYLIDMAEIPTFQEIRQFELTPKADDRNAARYLDRQVQLLKEGLSLENDGQPVRLETTSRQIAFTDGAGGLPTMKIAFVFRGEVGGTAGRHKLSYIDNNFPGRSGWKEIVVLGDGVGILGSSAPSTDRSQELSNYSSDALNSPPQQLSALVDFSTSLSGPEQQASAPAVGKTSSQAIPTVRPSADQISAPALPLQRQRQSAGAMTTGSITSGAITFSDFSAQSSPASIAASAASPPSPTAHAQNTPRSRFTELISTQSKLSFWVLFSAALVAAGLGALHALEPGHGKTIVAAYLVGSRGTARHAVLLGIVVTAAHTAGVYLLGALTLYASRYIVPEQLYPWLGAISGLSVAGLGIFIFLTHWTGEAGEHSHAPGEKHSHWFLSMFTESTFERGTFKQATLEQATAAGPANRSAASTDTRPPERSLSLRELCTLGITGGIVPCPAALVVLLSAFSLHRIGFGLFLITAFSLGLASVLVTVGLTMVYAKRVVSSRLRGTNAALRFLPILSSAFMVVLGVGITVSAAASVHIGQGYLSHDFLSREKLVPFATVILLGLFLGMRHSTDADHIVAVSTIVSRQRSIRSSATIGLLWGLGHTMTIFLVGSAIIIFGVVIPPRLGLSMEFCVALMLVLLGLLNLTGVMRWITERLTPRPNIHANTNALTLSLFRRMELRLDRTIGKIGLYQTIRPLIIGLIHGLAGSAAVALLVLSTIKSPVWSTAYLLVFGFGTMAGMMLMTAAISVPLVYTGKRFFKVNQHLATISGFASMAFGIFLVYHIGFVDGLFTSQVHWIPQ
jgi:ABC-type nickel/cobalt efflux system permease component RcnA/high-affinity nickel permease